MKFFSVFFSICFILFLQLISQQCNVRIPTSVYDRIHKITRSNAKQLNDYLSQSVNLPSDVFAEKTREMASNLTEQLSGKGETGEGGESLNLMDTFNTGLCPRKV